METIGDLIASPEARALLTHPDIPVALDKVKEVLGSSRYIFVNTRKIIAFFLRLSRFNIPKDKPCELAALNELTRRLLVATTLLPTFDASERKLMTSLLSIYFEPMLENFKSGDAGLTDGTTCDGRTPSDGPSNLRLPSIVDILSSSEPDDLPAAVREHPSCVRCGGAAAFVCNCKAVSYCCLVCRGLDWYFGNHICKPKLD